MSHAWGYISTLAAQAETYIFTEAANRQVS